MVYVVVIVIQMLIHANLENASTLQKEEEDLMLFAQVINKIVLSMELAVLCLMIFAVFIINHLEIMIKKKQHFVKLDLQILH